MTNPSNGSWTRKTRSRTNSFKCRVWLLRGGVFEAVAAGVWCDEFGFGPRVFAAIEGAYKINSTDSLVLFVKGKPWADVWQHAAGSAAVASAVAVLRDGQHTCEGSH